MAAVYFDLDGTLIDSSQCSVLSAQETFMKFCNVDISSTAIIEKMGVPIEVSFRELSNGKINDNNWDDVATYFRQIYKENSKSCTTLFDGIDDCLSGINIPSNQLFVVTSKKSVAAEYNLNTLGISHYFKSIIGSDKVEHYKPHPDPIYQARKFLTSPTTLEIMIGDADTDIIMGKSAGVKTCAVTWGAHGIHRLRQSQPDYIVDTVLELKNLILSL